MEDKKREELELIEWIKRYWWMGVIFIAVPFIIVPLAEMTNNASTWIGFLGAYVGAGMTIAGVFIQISYNRKRDEELIERGALIFLRNFHNRFIGESERIREEVLYLFDLKSTTIGLKNVNHKKEEVNNKVLFKLDEVLYIEFYKKINHLKGFEELYNYFLSLKMIDSILKDNEKIEGDKNRLCDKIENLLVRECLISKLASGLGKEKIIVEINSTYNLNEDERDKLRDLNNRNEISKEKIESVIGISLMKKSKKIEDIKTEFEKLIEATNSEDNDQIVKRMENYKKISDSFLDKFRKSINTNISDKTERGRERLEEYYEIIKEFIFFEREQGKLINLYETGDKYKSNEKTKLILNIDNLKNKLEKMNDKIEKRLDKISGKKKQSLVINISFIAFIVLVSTLNLWNGFSKLPKNLEYVFFKSNSYKIEKNELKKLDISNSKDISLEAYTDTEGDFNYNYDLAEKRAYAVKEFLINKGYKGGIEIKVYGESKNIINSLDENEEERNRVVIIREKD